MEIHGQKLISSSVDLINFMGTDKTVVDAARVSFNKQTKWDEKKDTKLIRYLAKHNHWSPFSHAFATFKIKAPIFVARQLVKHQVGLAWNEVSRRYVDSEVEIYTPGIWRGRPLNAKQGSGDALRYKDQILDYVYDDAIHHAKSAYNYLLSNGVAPEQARAVLPLSAMTEWYWSGSLYAFARVCVLRLAKDAQKETRDVAEGINSSLCRLFPVSWKELMNVNSTD